MLRRHIKLLSITLLAFGGCRSPQTLVQRVDDQMVTSAAKHTNSIPETASQSVKLVSYQATDSGLPAGGVVQATEPVDLPSSDVALLTLDAAISLSLAQNPDLAAIRATEPVAIAAMGVANTYIYNPQFQTQVLPYSRDRNGEDGAVSQQHVVVQTFELGGQQQHREGMASAGWRQVHNTVHQAELVNTAMTTRLYFSALYQRELRNLTGSLADMNEEVIGVIERRERAGQSNTADVELAKLQHRATRRQLRLAEAGYQTALTSLRNQLNFAANTQLELESQWMNWQWQPMGNVVGPSPSMIDSEGTVDSSQSVDVWDDSLLRQIVANRPDVVAARSAVSMASENMRLADAMRRPSLQAGPMYQRDSSSAVYWGVQAQIDLPVVNTGKPLLSQRMAELRLQQITATQLENRAILEARAAIQRYERARSLVEESRADFDRDLSKALKPFEDQFKAGQITLLQVFAARSTLVQSQQSFYDLVNELTQASADVALATGIHPQMLMTATP